MIRFKDPRIVVEDSYLFCGRSGFTNATGGSILKVVDFKDGMVHYKTEEVWGESNKRIYDITSEKNFLRWIQDFQDYTVLDPRTILRLKAEGVCFD